MGKEWTKRIFIAWELSADTKQALLEWQKKMIQAFPSGILRPIPAANFHLTTLFIGAAKDSQIRAIQLMLRNLDSGSDKRYPVIFTELDAFPTRSAGRVFMARASDRQGQLRRIRDDMAGRLDGIGLDFDHKPLIPHVTLAKLASGNRPPDGDCWKNLLQPPPLEASLALRPVLMESLSAPAGVHYRVLGDESV
jgi:2'-5' RNA ligase